MNAQHRTILFFLLHPGYLRPYIGVIEDIVERGHRVHVAFSEPARFDADERLARRASALAGVTVAEAPRRGPFDGWAGVAMAARVLADTARYAGPSYADSPTLRSRARLKARMRLRACPSLDPLSRRVADLAIRRLSAGTDPERARRATAAALRIESAVPPSRRIDRFLRRIAPDVVVVSPLVEIGSSQVDYVKSARHLGIPAVVAVASWDNLTNKGLLRVVPDRLVVWNEAQRAEAVDLHAIPADRVTVTGAQRFDDWFARQPSATPAEVLRRAGIAGVEQFVLYVCSSSFIAPNEVPFVERWLEHLRNDPALEHVGVIVRPHPKHAAVWNDVDLSRFGNAVVWPRAGAEPDESQARVDFFETLAAAAAVVGINTSVLVEAAILRKPVLGLVTDDFASTQVGTPHFQHLVDDDTGVLVTAVSFDEHLAQLRNALAHPESAFAAADRFVEWFLRPHGRDIPATPLVADAFLSARPVPTEQTTSIGLRGLLALPALLGAAAGALAVARGARSAEVEG